MSLFYKPTIGVIKLLSLNIISFNVRKLKKNGSVWPTYAGLISLFGLLSSLKISECQICYMSSNSTIYNGR